MNGSNTQLYATMNPSADNPTAETDATYWALQPALGGGLTTKGAIRWPSWLLSETKNPAYTADVVLYMNFSKGNYYTHAFEKEKEIPE